MAKDKLTIKIRNFNDHIKKPKLINIFFQLVMVFHMLEIDDYNLSFIN